MATQVKVSPQADARSDAQSMTLPHLLLEQAARQPNRVALREKEFGIWEEITWAQYAQYVRFFGLGLYSLGVRKGDRVAIMADNCREWLYADLAIQSIGAITVGIYPTNLEPAVQYVMEDSGSVVFIGGDQEHIDRCLNIRESVPAVRKLISIDHKGMWSYDEPDLLQFEQVLALGQQLDAEQPQLFDRLLAAISPQDVCMIIYTSGTTGAPKGAMLRHVNAICSVDDQIDANPMDESDSLISYLPLCHSAERLVSVFIPLRVGCVVNFAESLETVNEALFEISPTFFLGVPRIYETFASQVAIRIANADKLKQAVYRWGMTVGQREAELRLNHKPVPFGLKLQKFLAYWLVHRPILDKMGLLRVRLAYAGGSAVSPELMKYFHALGVPICETYGATELGGITFCHRLDDIKVGTCGKPTKNVEFYINEKGELYQRRKTDIFAGYLNKPEATASTIVDGWVKMGDTAELDEDGNLIIVGRTKDLYMLRNGKIVSPTEVETKLKFSPYINEAIVIGEGRDYNAALIQIELATCADYAQRHGIVYTTFRSLTEQQPILDLIQGEVDKINATLEPHERVERFLLLPKELNEDDGEITPTRKVKRRIISEKFGNFVERLYT